MASAVALGDPARDDATLVHPARRKSTLERVSNRTARTRRAKVRPRDGAISDLATLLIGSRPVIDATLDGRVRDYAMAGENPKCSDRAFARPPMLDVRHGNTGPTWFSGPRRP